MNSISYLRRNTFNAILTGLFLAAASGAYAQVGSINSAIIIPRVFNDVSGAIGNYVNSYPGSITLGESGMSQPTGFADRDVWRFSNNGGASAYQFANNDYFKASMTVKVTGNDGSIDNEAGFLLSSTSVGDIQQIVNFPGAFAGQFGGISFWNSGTPYALGNTVTFGMNYFFDTLNGVNALQFSANGVFSPVFDFAAGAGIGAGSTLGGYYQIQNDPANQANAGQAVFGNISISAVPEPAAFALLGLGALPLALRRRRS